MPGRMQRLSAAALLLSVPGAVALKSLPAPGAVVPGAPGWPPKNYNTVNTPAAQLATETAGSCDFIDSNLWEETFTNPVLNVTRWDPTSMSGQDHCVGLPPAGPTTCTMMLQNNFMLAQTFPASIGGGSGAIMTLSQSPCVANAAQCCNLAGTTCTSWSGAHLNSQGCVQYGVIEMELALNLPPSGGGFYFTATYIVQGTPDGSWNEVDVGMINGPLGLEFHATIFTASPAAPTTTTMDALNFIPFPIGTSQAGSNIGMVNGQPVPQMYYNATYAGTFHTYKVVWTPTWLAWMIDTNVYRNISYAIWRPQTIRQILRTNVGTPHPSWAPPVNTMTGPSAPPGTAGSTYPPAGALPDSTVYIRRIRYTPLSAQAITDALRCNSMFACYGALPTPAVGSALGVMSVSAPPTAAGRRLMSAVAANMSAVSDAIATTIPGITSSYSASQRPVTANIIGHAINGSIYVSGMTYQEYMSAGIVPGLMHSAFLKGLNDDCSRSRRDLLVQSVAADPNDDSSIIISFIVDNYTGGGDKGFTAATNDMNSMMSEGGLKNTEASMEAALGKSRNSQPLIGEGVVTADSSDPPRALTLRMDNNSAVFAVMTVQIRTPVSEVDATEAAFSGAVNSGVTSSALNDKLTAAGTVSVLPADPVQAQRALRNLMNKPPPPPPAKKKPPPPAPKKKSSGRRFAQ